MDFTDGALIGSFDSLKHFEATNFIRFELPLKMGWNWLSFNLDAQDDADNTSLLIPTVFESINDESVLSFKNQNAYTESYTFPDGSTSWFGSLTELPLEDMFMLKMDQADTIVFEGLEIDPTSITIEIFEGWNWISYLGQRQISLNEGLSSLTPSSGDIIKSKTAFSLFASQSLGWLGTLSNLNIGEGYMLNASSPGGLTYPISSGFSGRYTTDKNQYSSDYWTVDVSKYENSMSIIAKIDHPEYYTPNHENILGAFTGLECVGNITVTQIDESSSLYFITAYGTQGNLLEFDYYDKQKNKTYTSSSVLTFEANYLIGSIENPYPISIDVELQDELDNNLFTVYPNPFQNEFEIEFVLNESAKVEIKLFDVMGRLISFVDASNRAVGSHKLIIPTQTIKKGAYFVSIKVGDRSYRQLIVKS